MRLVAFGSVFILVHAEGSVRSKIAIKFVKVRFHLARLSDFSQRPQCKCNTNTN